MADGRQSKYPQALAAINKALELAVIASLLVTSARAGDHVPFVEPVSMLSGALLADSFDGTPPERKSLVAPQLDGPE